MKDKVTRIAYTLPLRTEQWLQRLAGEDGRTLKGEVAWLIRQEVEKRKWEGSNGHTDGNDDTASSAANG